MKRILLTFLSIAFIYSMSFGQSFADDFESYGVGDYLGASSSAWTTWGGTTGTSEDVRITDEQASSGANSIKFASTSANGGPQDVVLYYGGSKLTSGFLNTKMNMYIESGAYFNFQGEVAIGTTWSMNAFFEANGVGRITGPDNVNVLTFNYPEGEWFSFEMNINFDANKWQLKVNDECVGSFASSSNAIASIDIFPLNGNSFFIDDFSYDYNEMSPEIMDDASAILKASFENGLAGTIISLGGEFTNGGATVIESFEVEANVGGDVIPFSLDGLSLANGESVDFTISDEFAIPEGYSEVEMIIKSVNNGTFNDEDLCNDISKVFLFGTTPAEHKRVIVEEATGTWCGWCPRGTVWMDRMANKYPDRFIGIAVHNGDPMVNEDYDSGLGASAFPNATVNRYGFVDPGSIEPPFLQRVQEDAAAIMLNGALYDEDTRELSISLVVTALENISPAFKVNVALTEDGVKGTTNGYAQVNYYSNNQDLIDDNGVNWRDLPSTVPAANMVYDHVARAILAPYGGMLQSFDAVLSEGEEKVFNFSYTVPAGFNIDNMHLITMLINPNTTVNTGGSTTIEEAIENGYRELVSTHDVQLTNATSVYPNPFSQTTTVAINLSETSDVSIEIMDMTGKSLMQKTYNNQNGFFNTVVDGSTLPVGMYVMKISTNDKFTTKRISIVR